SSTLHMLHLTGAAESVASESTKGTNRDRHIERGSFGGGNANYRVVHKICNRSRGSPPVLIHFDANGRGRRLLTFPDNAADFLYHLQHVATEDARHEGGQHDGEAHHSRPAALV